MGSFNSVVAKLMAGNYSIKLDGMTTLYPVFITEYRQDTYNLFRKLKSK